MFPRTSRVQMTQHNLIQVGMTLVNLGPLGMRKYSMKMQTKTNVYLPFSNSGSRTTEKSYIEKARASSSQVPLNISGIASKTLEPFVTYASFQAHTIRSGGQMPRMARRTPSPLNPWSESSFQSRASRPIWPSFETITV